MPPAQASQVVEQGFRKIALFVILQDADSAVALRKLLTVFTVDQRQVCERRQGCADSVVQIDLTRSVVDVVSTADNVADLHIPVVNNNGKVVSRDAIASHDHEIVQFGIRNSNFAVNTVFPSHNAIVRVTETNNRCNTFGNRFTDTVFWTPATVITRFFAAGLLCFTHLIKLFLSGVALVG